MDRGLEAITKTPVFCRFHLGKMTQTSLITLHAHSYDSAASFLQVDANWAYTWPSSSPSSLESVLKDQLEQSAFSIPVLSDDVFNPVWQVDANWGVHAVIKKSIFSRKSVSAFGRRLMGDDNTGKSVVDIMAEWKASRHPEL